MDWMVDWWWMVDVDGTDVCGAFPPKLLSRQNDPAALLSRQYGASSFLHVSGALLAPDLRAASAATIMKDIAKVTTEGVNSTSG